MKLLAPLKQDLAEWRMASGRPDDDEYVLPAQHECDGSGGAWSEVGFRLWARRVLKPAAEAVGRPDVTPYHLRHSFASLLAHEGRSVVYVAAQLGHGPQLSVRVYQHVFAEFEHVFAEFEDQPRKDAEQAIREAREQVPVRRTG